MSARTTNAGIDWYNSAGTFLSTSRGTGVADTTTGWTQVTVTATAPANAAFCRASPQVVATGAGSEVHYLDDVTLSLPATQQATVTRSVNGAVKAQATGTAANLFSPVYYALV